jgi:mono/diheme cytochrome c family protein
LNLPNTEPQLLKQLGIDEQFLGQNYLIRGGAVLGGVSIVARNNRELQLLPSPFGADERFFWRSLDVADNGKKEASVIENFMGTLKIDGGEHIWTLRGGLHAYYIMDGQRSQVADVPVQIAQDHDNPHDARVIVPYKCVSCHGPKGGIRHFDDVVSRMAKNPKIGLAVITKNKYRDNQLREALEDYYMSDLGTEIAKHQRSYNRIVQEVSGQDAVQVTTKYVELIDEYFYARIGKLQAARELAIEPAQLDSYLKQTGNTVLLAILAGESVQRSEFERAFGDGMKARIYPWERSPQHVDKSSIKVDHRVRGH